MVVDVDVDRSRVLWRDVCGFEIRHWRPEERFAYIALGSAHLMPEQIGVGRNWCTGPPEATLGRGTDPDGTADCGCSQRLCAAVTYRQN